MMKQMRIAACGVLLAGTLAAGAQIVVRIGPPPPRPVEVIPVAPGPDYAWHRRMPTLTGSKATGDKAMVAISGMKAIGHAKQNC
jgi:hypothetical protein